MTSQADPGLPREIQGERFKTERPVTSPNALKSFLRLREIIQADLDDEKRYIRLYTREPLPGRKANVAELIMGLVNPATLPAPLPGEYAPAFDNDGLTAHAALAWHYLSHPEKLPLEDLLSAIEGALFTPAGNLGSAWLPMAALLDRAGIRRIIRYIAGENGERAGEITWKWKSGQNPHTFTRADGLSYLAWAFLGTQHSSSFIHRKTSLPVFRMNQFRPDTFVHPFDRAADFLDELAVYPGASAILDSRICQVAIDDSFILAENVPVPLWETLRVLIFSHMNSLAYDVAKHMIPDDEARRLRNRFLQSLKGLLPLNSGLRDGILELRALYGTVPYDSDLQILGLGGNEGFREWVEEAAARGAAARALQTPEPDTGEGGPVL
jgi:hypothetical protein